MPFLAAIPAAITASAIGAGGVVGASLIGRSSANRASNVQQQQTDLANRQLRLTEPALQDSIEYYRKILAGDFSPLSPTISAIGQNFDTARRNTLNSAVARGGSLSRALTNIEAGHASTLAQLLGQSQPSAAEALASIATGNINTAGNILGAAGQAGAINEALRTEGLSQIGSFFTRLLAPIAQGGLGRSQPPSVANNPAFIPAAVGSNLQFPPTNSSILPPGSGVQFGNRTRFV